MARCGLIIFYGISQILNKLLTEKSLLLSCPFLSSFGKSEPMMASHYCSWRTGVVPDVVFSCCVPSISRFDVLCVLNCFSVHYAYIVIICILPGSSQILSPQQGVSAHRTVSGCWIRPPYTMHHEFHYFYQAFPLYEHSNKCSDFNLLNQKLKF